jgi:hypothetical protein
MAVLRSGGDTIFNMIPIRMGSVYAETKTINQRKTPKI